MAAGVDPDGKTTTRPQPHSITLEQHSVAPCEQPAHILDNLQATDDNADSFSRERGEVANLNEYMAVGESAAFLCEAEVTLCRWTQQGELPRVQIGGQVCTPTSAPTARPGRNPAAKTQSERRRDRPEERSSSSRHESNHRSEGRIHG